MTVADSGSERPVGEPEESLRGAQTLLWSRRFLIPGERQSQLSPETPALGGGCEAGQWADGTGKGVG